MLPIPNLKVLGIRLAKARYRQEIPGMCDGLDPWDMAVRNDNIVEVTLIPLASIIIVPTTEEPITRGEAFLGLALAG